MDQRMMLFARYVQLMGLGLLLLVALFVFGFMVWALLIA